MAARPLLAAVLIVMLACGAAADMARPLPRRLMGLRTGTALTDSAAKASTASANGNTASASDSKSLSSASASNGQVSSAASLNWDFDRDKDFSSSNFASWTSYKP